MNSIKRWLKSALKKAYYRLARPLQVRFRDELQTATARLREDHADLRTHCSLVSERVFAELRQAGMQGRAELQGVATACHQRHAAVCRDLASEKEKLADELRRLRAELATLSAELTRARQEAADARKVPTEVWEELARMNQCYLQFHSRLTQHVADEVNRINRTLESGGAKPGTGISLPAAAAAA